MPRLATLSVLALSLIVSSQAALAQTWKLDRPQHGIRVESRIVAGERFEELRLTTDLSLAPETIATYLMGGYLDLRNERITRKFESRTPAAVVWSDLLKLPMMSPRCYSMRFERRLHSTGQIEIRFTTKDARPAVAARSECTLLRTRGSWHLRPTPAGTQVTYVSLTDVGGKVPAGLASRTLRDAAITSVRKVAAGAAGLKVPHGLDE